MDIPEFLIFMSSLLICIIFFKLYYEKLIKSWNPRNRLSKNVLSILPLISLIFILIVLMTLADVYVINSPFIMFYAIWGLTWLVIIIKLISIFFDISYLDDILGLNNHAALLAFVGITLGTTLIYAGANIGDGPGWWCVFIAGGLGILVFFGLTMLLNLITKFSERITIDRRIGCGIRFCFYFIAFGIILGKACSGDWTSFTMTIIEFLDCYPILILFFFIIIIELFDQYRQKEESYLDKNYVTSALIIGIITIAFAVLCLFYAPSLSDYLKSLGN